MSLFKTISVADTKETIALLVISMRKNAKLSRQQLAEELGVSRITVQNLENGKNVTLDTFFKVLQYFGRLEKYQQFIVDDIEDQNYKPLY